MSTSDIIMNYYVIRKYIWMSQIVNEYPLRISILDISNKIDYINILLLTRFLASRIILFTIAKSVASRWYQKDAWSLKEKILTWKNSKNGKKFTA